VTIVDLMNMRDEFASILEQQVTGTNVEATFVLHHGLYIRDPDHPEEKLQKLKRNIGNVTKHTEVTFEFGVRNKEGGSQKSVSINLCLHFFLFNNSRIERKISNRFGSVKTIALSNPSDLHSCGR
jgi:hypothetical protein